MESLLVLCLLPMVFGNQTVEYLQHFGYISNSSLTTDIGPAVRLFQETFGLEATGKLTEETVRLMETPRCGNKDDLLPFTADPNIKWLNNTITWKMYGQTTYYDSIIERAFGMWAKHANLTFKKDPKDPMIILAFSQRKHMIYFRRANCNDFDGPGTVLAHAYPPDSYYNKTEVHFDQEESWDSTLNAPLSGNVSFYMVLLHEIGHALGLSHSYTSSSIMFPYYGVPQGITDLRQYNLDRDDVSAVQFLYGVRPASDTTPQASTTTTTTTTTTSTTTTKDGIQPIVAWDLCTLRKGEMKTFLIVNKRIYVFYRQFVWVLALDPKLRSSEEYTHPKRITDWLSFLPRNFYNVSAIYQKPNGDVALFAEKEVYVIQYPGLTLVNRYAVDSVLGRKVEKVNAVLSNNRGRTYIFHDDQYVSEYNECSRRSTFLGHVSSTFPGVPQGLDGAFRYVNGRLYFLTASSVFEFDEFTETVTKVESDILDILKITCFRETLVRKLYDVLRYFK